MTTKIDRNDAKMTAMTGQDDESFDVEFFKNL